MWGGNGIYILHTYIYVYIYEILNCNAHATIHIPEWKKTRVNRVVTKILKYIA